MSATVHEPGGEARPAPAAEPPSPHVKWFDLNQRHLVASLALLRARLTGADATQVASATRQIEAAAASLRAPPAIERIGRAFQLSPFEKDLLLLCAGIELDDQFAAATASARGVSHRAAPTFSLALATLPGAHWTAIGPMSPLRRFRLIEIGPGEALTRSPLRIDEWALHFLAGAYQLDERLAALLEPPPVFRALVPSQQELADRIAAIWSQKGQPTLLQLCGDARDGKRAIAAAAAAALGMRLDVLPAAALGNAVDATLPMLLTREAILGRSAIFIDGEELDSIDAGSAVAVRRLLDQLETPTVVAGRERLRLAQHSIAIEVRRPTAREQRAIWQASLTASGDPAATPELATPLARQFDLSDSSIRSACTAALADPVRRDLGDALWDACRSEARPRLDDLAQRIDALAGWDDLVLPAAQTESLREIALHARHRSMVYEDWGFENKSRRGLGISALFTGVSGTGKTMATEVLAHELRLDLYRIDLSQVVSKYIGETEKNLRRVFDAAEHGASILLFDEADALFGRRSEVKDSHDRYANIEVGYLLQRMEAYRGLAVLTTNLKSALDPAFMRRLRFVVQFPFPGPAERAEIWRRVFPKETPVSALDIERLGRLNIAGGSIRNIALNAAFLAAGEGTSVQMAHVIKAAQGEFAKLERSLTQGELRT